MSDDDTGESQSALECYDLPWCMGCISRVKLFKYLPICPTFNYSHSCSCRRRNKAKSNKEDNPPPPIDDAVRPSFIIIKNDIPAEDTMNRVTSF